MSKPAARIGGMHICPKVEPGPVPHIGGPVAVGAPTVIVGGMPAARVGVMAICIGPPDRITQGSTTVFIGGKPAARMGDSMSHGGKLVVDIHCCPVKFESMDSVFVSATFTSMDAGVELTGMYSQRVAGANTGFMSAPKVIYLRPFKIGSFSLMTK